MNGNQGIVSGSRGSAEGGLLENCRSAPGACALHPSLHRGSAKEQKADVAPGPE